MSSTRGNVKYSATSDEELKKETLDSLKANKLAQELEILELKKQIASLFVPS